MKCTRLVFLALLVTISASASVLYTFSESWINPYNIANPQGTFGFSFAEPTFLSDAIPYFIAGNAFETCNLSGMDPLNTCSGAWVSFDTTGVSVELLADYPCSDCDMDPYQLARVFFPGADLETYGDSSTQAGTGIAEFQVTDPPNIPGEADAPADVPEPATAAILLLGFATLAAFWKIRRVLSTAPIPKRRP